MRIKTDFVTNSSSTSYIISGETPFHANNVGFEPQVEDEPPHYTVITNKRQLINYALTLEATDKEIDWVTDVVGIIGNNEYLTQDDYNTILKEINNNRIVTLTSMSYHEDLDKFHELVEKAGYTIINYN